MRRTAALEVLGCACWMVLVPSSARAADVRVCVEVVIKSHEEDAPEPDDPAEPGPGATEQDPAGEGGSRIDLGQLSPTAREAIVREAARLVEPPPNYPFPPRPYLRRLIEHYVTHKHGFLAVETQCDERLRVELYPLYQAWTVFGRYSGHDQEEKVDHVEFAEFPRLAERLVLALLENRPIEETITRLTVLEADSAQEVETVRGSHHFGPMVGSSVRFAVPGVPTARENPEAAATDSFRIFTPINLQFSYRGTFHSWAFDALLRAGVGVGHKSQRNNVLGGHVEHTADVRFGMNLLWYLEPEGVNSFYLGSGATVDLSWYRAVKPVDPQDGMRDFDPLFGGGVSFVGVLGYEFLRTTGVRPVVQLELDVPAYVFDTENDAASLNAWFPAVTLMAGVLF